MNKFTIGLLETLFADYGKDFPGVYKPKRVGRRSNRYKRYFKAMTPPEKHWILGPSSRWSDKKVEPEPDIVKIVDGKIYVTYKPRTNGN